MIKWVADWMARSAAVSIAASIVLCWIIIIIGFFTSKYIDDISAIAVVTAGIGLVFLLYAVGLALFLRLYNE